MDRDVLSGFSLAEVLVVLVIISILTFLVVPGFVDLVRSNRLTVQAHRFVAALNLARSEAIKRNRRTYICIRASDGSLDRCSDGQAWENGWIVYSDENTNRKPDGHEIIQVFDPIAQGYELRSNGRVSALAYRGDGMARRAKGGLPMMTFRLCAPDARNDNVDYRAREIVVSASGRLRLQKGRVNVTDCSS